MEEKNQSHIVVNFVVRAVVGCGAIFFINQFLASQGISLEVGYNGLSILTSGCLGIPGVALLYGVLAYQIL